MQERLGLKVVTVILIAGILAGGSYLIYKQFQPKNTPYSGANSASKTTSSNNSGPYAVLSPASVPSKTVECEQQISYASNGVPQPVTCSSGGLNVTEWNALAALEPKVLTLGYGVSASQVQSTLCSDVEANISNPIEEAVYQISALYYGWSFSSDPSVVLTNGTCQNVDD